jgi:signal transduction histidine kinase
VLWLEDEPAHVDMGVSILERGGFKLQVEVVATRDAFERHVQSGAFDVVIADFELPTWTGLEALESLRKTDTLTPFILLTGRLPEETALECIEKGVTDYVLKDHLARLAISVRLALMNRNAQRRISRSREQLRTLAARLQSIREEERSRIAREVHDVLGQTLTGIKMDAAWILAKLPEGQTKLVARAKSMSSLIDSMVQMVRRIATDLRPGILDNLGLWPRSSGKPASSRRAPALPARLPAICVMRVSLPTPPRRCSAFSRKHLRTLRATRRPPL